jgi:hypothetical protein
MSDENLENLDLTDEQIDEILNAPEEDAEQDNDDSEDVEALKAKLQQKDAINRQLLARAKKAEQEKKQNFDKPIIKKQENKQDDIRQTVQELKVAEEKRQFGYANGLSPEETDYIFKINPNPTEELLKDDFVKGGLEAIRTKKKVETNTPALNSRSPRFELPKKKDLSVDDKQKAFDDYRIAKFGK